MPNGEASLQFVTVGNPGNPPDDTNWAYPNQFGSVAYVYQMGKYDVTVGQYCQFLNAAAKADTYGLYNGDMSDDDYPGSSVGIVRSGSPGSYTYSISYSTSSVEQLRQQLPEPLSLCVGGGGRLPDHLCQLGRFGQVL